MRPAHVTVPSAFSVTGSEGRQPGDLIPPCCYTILTSAAGIDGSSDLALAVDDIGFEGQLQETQDSPCLHPLSPLPTLSCPCLPVV